MVIGNGMIAKAFSSYQTSSDVIIFASGVSNSQEQRESEFLRELTLLQGVISERRHLVYFSSTSIYDDSVRNTPYVVHKIRLEQYIRDNAQSYTIFRLPIVVGNTNNPTALVKLIYDQIMHEETVHVFGRACRYFLDVEDLAYIVGEILRTGVYKNDIVDMCVAPSLPIGDVISAMEATLGKVANKINLDKGGCYQVPSDKIQSFLQEIGFTTDVNYGHRIIAKYYK